MLLAIDSGNTNVTFALVDGDSIRCRWRISTDARRTADEYLVWLYQLMDVAGVPRRAVDDVVIASVVPQALFNLRGLARRIADVEPLVAGAPGVEYGIPIHLPNPSELGADRVVNALAARSLWPGECIIVDFGTATTFDIVSAAGAYEGGVIAPGINLSVEALYQAAARLPKVAVEPPQDGLGVIGKGTVHAMKSGLFWGYVGLVEGLIARIGAELPGPATVVATGGLAPLFARHTPAIDHVEPDLMVKGLILLYRHNRKGADGAAGG